MATSETMHRVTEQSDAGLMDLLREAGSLGVTDLATAMQVTATAIRQRLSRLMAEGLIERELNKAARGRPSHRYRLTEKAIRQSGSNFADLAIALWQEVRQIKDPEIRTGLLRRIARAMAGAYGGQVSGETTSERMESVRQLLAERKVPFAVDSSGPLPVLTALACPYPALAEQDRGICAVEKMLFSELLNAPVQLTECRLDGASTCCRFQTN
ncbi:MAG TPA: ArsR family transcriptional regulator [Pirellulales bacterium]|nr:ArsR family transcriptional regulator [Pirellulales bacterium]